MGLVVENVLDLELTLAVLGVEPEPRFSFLFSKGCLGAEPGFELESSLAFSLIEAAFDCYHEEEHGSQRDRQIRPGTEKPFVFSEDNR